MTKDSVKVPPLKESKATDAPEQDEAKIDNDTSARAKAAMARQTVKVLYVVAKREGFRRAGFVFGSERTRVVVDDLPAEHVRQLKEEPMLVVTEATEEI